MNIEGSRIKSSGFITYFHLKEATMTQLTFYLN